MCVCVAACDDLQEGLALMIICTSGGARMQEGILSLMQVRSKLYFCNVLGQMLCTHTQRHPLAQAGAFKFHVCCVLGFARCVRCVLLLMQVHEYFYLAPT